MCWKIFVSTDKWFKLLSLSIGICNASGVDYIITCILSFFCSFAILWLLHIPLTNMCLTYDSHLDVLPFWNLPFFLGSVLKLVAVLEGSFRWWPSLIFLLPLGSLEELLGQTGDGHLWRQHVPETACLKKLGSQCLDMMGIIRIHCVCVCVCILVQAECCWFGNSPNI